MVAQDADSPRPASRQPGFDVATIARFSALVVSALAKAREEIDALNVYPIPDGDTGTNLFLTFEAAHANLRVAIEERGGVGSAQVLPIVAAYSRGLLLGARGNSGVIMSQLVGSLLRHLVTADPDRDPATVLAQAMAVAVSASYAAVGTPVEGTMLTVARVAAEEAAELTSNPDVRVSPARMLERCAVAADAALARTPDQLEVLRHAGVVDAGGRGLCLIFEVGVTVFTGKVPVHRHAPLGRHAIPVPAPTDDLTEDGPAYEVMYLLDAADQVVPGLRARLTELGDSVVVVGADGLWNIHVHTDDVGAAIEAGIIVGRPHRVRVTHFAEQVVQAREVKQRTGRAVVVVAIGAGLAEVYAEAGAHVLSSTVRRRPSTGELLEAIKVAGTAEVVLLPNSKDVLPAAQAAAHLAQTDLGVRAAVIPTYAQVQALAALAVHEPGRPFDQDLVEMSAAARHARSGAITVAARQAITTAGACEPGDILGAVEGNFAVVGQDPYDVAVQIIDRLLGGGGELCTVVYGVDGAELAARCAAYLQSAHPTVEAMVLDGGQEHYPLLFGVE